MARQQVIINPLVPTQLIIDFNPALGTASSCCDCDSCPRKLVPGGVCHHVAALPRTSEVVQKEIEELDFLLKEFDNSRALETSSIEEARRLDKQERDEFIKLEKLLALQRRRMNQATIILGKKFEKRQMIDQNKINATQKKNVLESEYSSLLTAEASHYELIIKADEATQYGIVSNGAHCALPREIPLEVPSVDNTVASKSSLTVRCDFKELGKSSENA